jgi:hypothetical protein
MTPKTPQREVQRFGCSTCGRFIGLIITENGRTTFPEFDMEDAGDCVACQGRVTLLEEFRAEEERKQRPVKPGPKPRKVLVAV